jgi:hypothetical protein
MTRLDTRSPSRRARFSDAGGVQLAAKFANTVLLRVQATRMACLQEVSAGRCHTRLMTPGFDAAVSTTVPESHWAKRDQAVLANLLLAPLPCVVQAGNESCRFPGLLDGRYWARTSDPQLVDSER